MSNINTFIMFKLSLKVILNARRVEMKKLNEKTNNLFGINNLSKVLCCCLKIKNIKYITLENITVIDQ